MTDIAIRANGLSKKYFLGQATRFPALSNGMLATMKALGKKPSKSNGHIPDQSFWALHDVSFEIQRGDVVGIIGRNGAGKSTLLKILSRITEPSAGSVELHGRVAALLEVGVGFHPELSGRDNIYLNGAVLGMKRSEIARKFDAIVDFSGVEKFISMPVKRYSSGMYVRLAFAVAAFLESDILLVDEVLAVGDMAFQKRCLGRMDELAKGGRTVIFISHNMAAITQLCQRVLIMAKGQLVADETAQRAVEVYLAEGSVSDEGCRTWSDRPRDAKIWPELVEMRNYSGDVVSTIGFDQPVTINLLVQVYEPSSFRVGFVGVNSQYVRVFSTYSTPEPVKYDQGQHWFTWRLPSSLLAPDLYRLCVIIQNSHGTISFQEESALSWAIEETGSPFAKYQGRRLGVICLCPPWEITKVEADILH